MSGRTVQMNRGTWTSGARWSRQRLGWLIAMLAVIGNTRAADGFQWVAVPGTVDVGSPFPVEIRAIANGQLDPSFEGDVVVNSVVEAPPTGLLFSELSCVGATLQLVNAGTTPKAVQGSLRLYRRLNAQLPTVEFPLLDPATTSKVILQPGQRIILAPSLTSGPSAEGYRRALPFNAVDVLNGSPAAMALLDGAEVVDFWLGTATAAPELQAIAYPGGAALWEGPELYAKSQFLGAQARRVGAVRTRSAADWRVVGQPEPVPATVPLPGTPQIRATSPGRVHLTAGRWSGELIVSNAAPQVRLSADDLAGHPGESDTFVVRPLPQLTLVATGTNAVAETGLPIPIELRLSVPRTTNLPVALSASPAGKFSVPAEVVVPAGATTAGFMATPLRDAAVDGPQTVALVAAALGTASSAPLNLTVFDVDGPSMALVLPVLPAVPTTFPAPFTASLELGRPPDRDVTVRFETVLVKPSVVLGYSTGPILASVVVPAGASRVNVSGSLLPIPFAEPVQYRLRALVSGWPGAETVVTLTPPGPDPRIDLSWGRAFMEGSGANTNALTVSLHALFPTNVVVHLRVDPNPLLVVPSTVEIPAYTTSASVTPVIGEDDQLRGALIGSVYADAPGFAPSSDVFNVTDNEVGSVKLSGPPSPGVVSVVKSGATNTFFIQAYSIWPNASAFSGKLAVSFDAGPQPVTYTGPDSVELSGGSGRMTCRLDGAGFNVRLRFTTSAGVVIDSDPFEVQPDRTAPLEPADLEILPTGISRVELGKEILVPVTLANHGPAAAERLAVLASAVDPVLAGGTYSYRWDLGTVPAGQTRIVNVPISGRFPGLESVDLQVWSDNPDTAAAGNTAKLRIAVENPPRSGIGELVQPSGDLAFSAETGRFYYSSKGGEVEEIVELDPETLVATRRFTVPLPAGMLAVTSDGHQLYALLGEGTDLLRLDLASWQTNLHVKLASPAQDIATVPALPQRVVVYEPAAGTQLLNEGLPRGAIAGDYGWLEPDMNGTAIVSFSGNLFRYNASGASLTRTATGGAFFVGASAWGGFRVLENRVYLADGTRWVGGNTAGTLYTGIAGGVDVLPDPARNRIYFAAIQGAFLELSAHSLSAGGGPVAGLGVTGVQGSVNRLTRWGSNGLGFRSTGGQLFFIRSTLVPSGPETDLRVEMAEAPRLPEDMTYSVRVKVSNVGANETAQARIRLTHPAADAASAAVPLEVERPGVSAVNLGRLAVGESRELSIQFQTAVRGTRAVAVQAMPEGSDPDLGNNSATVIVHVKEPGVAALDIAANQLIYDPVGDQFLAAVNFVGGQPVNGILALDPHSAMPRRWYPLPVVPGALARADDSSVVYVTTADRTEIRRVRMADGLVDANIKMPANIAVGDLLVVPGRPDLLVVSRSRTDQSPSYVDVSVYKDGTRLAGASNRAAYQLVAPGPLGEVWGGITEAGQFNRFHVDDSGVKFLSATGSGISGNTRALSLAGDWIVGTAGDIHARADGAVVGSMPFSIFLSAMAGHPSAGRMATLSPNYPGVPMARMILWDVAAQKPVADRLLEELPGGANTLAYSIGDTFCFGGTASTGPRVMIHERAQLTGTRISFTWTTATRNVGPEPFDTEFVLKNEGQDPAANVSVTLPVYPLEIVESSVSAGGSLGANLFGTPTLVAASVPPGGQITGRLRLRASVPALVSLMGTVTSSTMFTEPPAVRGDVVLSLVGFPDSILQGIPATCRDSVADTTRGQLWLALPSPMNALVALDIPTRRVVEVVRLDFEPNRLAASLDGRFLYAAPISGPVGRLNLSTRAIDLRIPLDETQPLLHGATDLVVNPENAEMIAVDVNRLGLSHAARLFLGSQPRSDAYFPGSALRHLTWMGPASLGLVYDDNLHRMALTPTGMQLDKVFAGVVPAGFPWIAEASSTRVLFHAGPALDLTTGAVDATPGEPGFRVVDRLRNRTYAMKWGAQFGVAMVRELIAKDTASGGEIWRASTGAAAGDPIRLLLPNAATVVALTADATESKVLWFANLPDLDQPPARLTLSASWNLPEVPTAFGAQLVVTLVNTGPAPARAIVLDLPAGFDSAFTNLVVEPDTLGVVRDGPVLKVPALPVGVGFNLRLGFGGSTTTGSFAPKFGVSAQSPTLPQPFPSIEPSILIRPAPVASLSPATGTEGTGTGVAGNASVVATIRLSTKTLVAGSVRVDAVAGTATAETDYRFSPTRVAIAAGRETVSVAVPIRADAVAEPTETFTLRLSEPIGVSLGTAEATMTILDDDLPTLSAVGPKLAEGDVGRTTVRVPLTLSAAPVEAAQVRYLLKDGSARGGLDYAAKRGVLQIAAGSTSAELVFEFLADTRPETAESFDLVLIEPTGLRLSAGTVSIGILDDDLEPELVLGLPQPGNGGMTVPTVEGATYRLERAEMATGPWLDVSGPVMGTGGQQTLIDPLPPTEAAFYRVLRE